jgi:ABC-type amino acid transport system permease subunit
MWFAAFFIVSINTGAYMRKPCAAAYCQLTQADGGAKAIGMNHLQTMLYVIFPQALRNIMPQIGNNLIINIKDSCVLSVITVVELFFASKSISGTYYIFFEVFTLAMVMYLIMTVFFSRLLRWFEKKMDGSDNYDLATMDTLAHTSGMYSFSGKR